MACFALLNPTHGGTTYFGLFEFTSYLTYPGCRYRGGGIGGGKNVENRVIGSVVLTEARIVASINCPVLTEAALISGDTDARTIFFKVFELSSGVVPLALTLDLQQDE